MSVAGSTIREAGLLFPWIESVHVLALVLLAGVNMLAFHPRVAHDMSEWQTPDTTPALAKAAGGVSMVLWIGVVVCGRWIGFV